LKQADLRDMLKKTSKSVCTSTILVSPGPFSPTPSTASNMKTPENAEEDPGDPKLTDEGDMQLQYSDQLYSPSIGAVTKNYL
jgi:hypothetical protein